MEGKRKQIFEIFVKWKGFTEKVPFEEKCIPKETVFLHSYQVIHCYSTEIEQNKRTHNKTNINEQSSMHGIDIKYTSNNRNQTF